MTTTNNNKTPRYYSPENITVSYNGVKLELPEDWGFEFLKMEEIFPEETTSNQRKNDERV